MKKKFNKVDRTKIDIFDYLYYVLSLEKASHKYINDVIRIFEKFIKFYKQNYKKNIRVKKNQENINTLIKRFNSQSLSLYIKALRIPESSKRKEFYIIKKYINIFNRGRRCNLKFRRLSNYIPKSSETYKVIYHIINSLKERKADEDILSFYFLEFGGLSFYSLSKLRINEIKANKNGITIKYFYNKKPKTKKITNEIYQIFKNQFVSMVNKESSVLVYSSIKGTSKKSRKELIEKKMKKLLKSIGVATKDINDLINKYNTERKANKTKINEKLILNKNIEIGNGLIDSDLSLGDI